MYHHGRLQSAETKSNMSTKLEGVNLIFPEALQGSGRHVDRGLLVILPTDIAVMTLFFL